MTDEPIDLVAPWIEANNVTHPVVILPDGALEKVIGVTGFPTSAVFYGTEKKWTGHPGGSGGALGKYAKEGRKDSIYPKKLSKVFKAWDKADRVKALVELKKLQPKLEGEDAAWATRMESFMLETCAKDFAASAAEIDAGYWYRGVQLVQPYLGKGSLYPELDKVSAKLAELKMDKNYASEIAGGEGVAKAEALVKQMAYADAVKAYKSAVKKGGESQISQHALAAGQELINNRNPGFKPTCPNCKGKTKSACSKHYEEMKM